MIVVDTNILVYRFLPSPKKQNARKLASLDPMWAAPLLWRSELRNVLTGYFRREEIRQTFAEEVMRLSARALFAGEHAVDDSVVFTLVQNSNCTSYDCEFVALAKRFNSFLVTEDRALLNAFPECCRNLASMVSDQSA